MDGITLDDDRAKKPVSPLRNGFDVVRACGVVSKSLSQFANRNSQTAVEIDESVGLPDTLLDLHFGNDFAGIFKKDDEQSKWLFLQSNTLALFQQFAGDDVRLEWAKSINRLDGRLQG
jgi:hypothetical protein